MKKLTTLLLVAGMILSLVACGNNSGNNSNHSNSDNNEVADNVETSSGYTVDIQELDPFVYPADYPLIAFADFKAAFIILKEANMNGELKDYQDIVDIFGEEGAYYENCDLTYGEDLYKYYGWYADNEVSVLITFKVDGNDLTYFAYTENGVIITE